jgi:hypothetical protein
MVDGRFFGSIALGLICFWEVLGLHKDLPWGWVVERLVIPWGWAFL